MKALELAVYLEGIFVSEDLHANKARDIATELRRLAAVEAELERIKALPPVAWEVYVADADNAYVVDSLDDPQLIDDCTNSDAVVTPLIALGSKTDE